MQRRLVTRCTHTCTVSASRANRHVAAVQDVPRPPSTPAPPVRSAYVHTPFCRKKCLYCDFAVLPIGRGSSKVEGRGAAAMQEYVQTLCSEIRATPPRSGAPLETLYFGGGTPSLLPLNLFEQVLDTLKASFGLAAHAEVTLEADPGTFDERRLRDYLALGVTRFSVGVQAFQQELLEVCGRSHGLDDVHAALRDIRAAQPPSWSLDLISGLPTLTRAHWEASLRAAIEAEPDHISVYDLQVEPGTPFARRYKPGVSPLPAHDEAADLLRLAAQTLQAAGFEHYEVSSFARPGHRSRHNTVYWTGNTPYYAFGLGASSFLDNVRYTRPRSAAAYRRWVDEYQAQGGRISGGEVEDELEALLSLVMLRLRLPQDGLDLGVVAARFGESAALAVSEGLARQHRLGNVSFRQSTSVSTQGTEARWQTAIPMNVYYCNDIASDVYAKILSQSPVLERA